MREPTRPWLIEAAYLFTESDLERSLRDRGALIGVATSVRRELRSAAEVHPSDPDPLLTLSATQHGSLRLFSALPS